MIRNNKILNLSLDEYKETVHYKYQFSNFLSGIQNNIIYKDEYFYPCNILYNDDYLISNYGRVYNVKTSRFIDSIIDKNYIYYNISPRLWSADLLVLMTFNPVLNIDRYKIIHLNLDTIDNRLINLKWDNIQNYDIYYINEFLKLNKLPCDRYMIKSICNLSYQGLSIYDISDRLNIRYEYLYYIINNLILDECWMNIIYNRGIYRYTKYMNHFTVNELRKLYKLFESRKNNKTIIENHFNQSLSWKNYLDLDIVRHRYIHDKLLLIYESEYSDLISSTNINPHLDSEIMEIRSLIFSNYSTKDISEFKGESNNLYYYNFIESLR